MQYQTRKIEPMSGSGNSNAPVPRPQLQPMQPSVQTSGAFRTLISLGANSLMLLFIVGLIELAAPSGWKPTDIIATAMVNYETAMIEGTMVPRSEAEQLIAEARTSGERAAEIEFQAELRAIEFDYAQQLANVQTNLQTGMTAYQSLYERTNQIYQGAIQMEQTVLAQQQAAIRDTQSGQSFLANGADLLCPLMPELCQVSDRIREDMADDLVTAGRSGRGSIMRDMLAGIEDPASLRSRIMPQTPTSTLPAVQ